MQDQIITKTTEHYNEELDKTYKKTSSARQLQFSGNDWLFFQRRIETLSETELLMAIEYHRGILNGMILERDKRRIEHAHRNVGKRFIVPTSKTTTTTTTTTKKVKTTKAVAPEQAAANAKALIEQMLQGGYTPDQILALFGKK